MEPQFPQHVECVPQRSPHTPILARPILSIFNLMYWFHFPLIKSPVGRSEKAIHAKGGEVNGEVILG